MAEPDSPPPLPQTNFWRPISKKGCKTAHFSFFGPANSPNSLASFVLYNHYSELPWFPAICLLFSTLWFIWLSSLHFFPLSFQTKGAAAQLAGCSFPFQLLCACFPAPDWLFLFFRRLAHLARPEKRRQQRRQNIEKKEENLNFQVRFRVFFDL